MRCRQAAQLTVNGYTGTVPVVIIVECGWGRPRYGSLGHALMEAFAPLDLTQPVTAK